MAQDDKDGIDRRSALECMIWAGTGVLWTMVDAAWSGHPEQ